MTQKINLQLTTFAALAAAILLAPSAAAACGGVFCAGPGPTSQPTQVNAHRMVISISAEESILWDQIEYEGDSDDFVWVLPVADPADAQVDLADDAFFQALTSSTALTLVGPTPPFRGGGGGSIFGCGASASAAPGAAPEERVTVHYQGTVGPYETAQISSDDPDALIEWLRGNGYAVPDAMLPTIRYYTEREMGFVALRLSGNADVDRMQPVRVTSPGANVVFPLRMVAAGAVDEMSLELFVIGEGRYEVANFPNAEVPRELVTYDWDTDRFDYDALADLTLAQNRGRTWITEAAVEGSHPFFENFSLRDPDGTEHRAEEDWRAATAHLDAPVITRMRAVLPIAALSEDLVLRASSEPLLGTLVQVTNSVNEPGSASLELREPTSNRGLALLFAPFVLSGAIFGARRSRRRKG